MSLDPEGMERRRALAELYRLSGPEAYPRAAAQHQALVARAKTAAEMEPDLRMLVRLFVEMGMLDQAHGAAAALVLIGKADAAESALYEQYRPNGVVRAQARLTEEVWQKQILSPRGGLGAVADPGDSVAGGGHHTRSAVQGHRSQEEAAARRRLRSLVAVQGVRLRRRGAGRPDAEVYLSPELPGDIDVVNLRSPPRRARPRWSLAKGWPRCARTSSWPSWRDGRWRRCARTICCAGRSSCRRWRSWRSSCARRSDWSTPTSRFPPTRPRRSRSTRPSSNGR